MTVAVRSILNDLMHVSAVPPDVYDPGTWCWPPEWLSMTLWNNYRTDGQDFYIAIQALECMCDV